MDVMQLRRNLLMQKIDSGGLPVAYQQVEWIERTVEGATIVIQGDELNVTGCDVFAKFTILGPNSGERAYMGCNSAQAPNCFAWEVYLPSIAWYVNPNKITVVSSTITELGTPGEIHITVESTMKTGLVLGQYRYGAYQSQNRIHYCRIERNGEVLRELYPCYRKSDNEIGMFDVITKQFYANTGTGEFTIPT